MNTPSTQLNQLSPVLVELKVEIPWDQVKTTLDRSFEQATKHARVKGFRPGKVPANLVRQIYGSQVRGDVATRLIEESFITAVQQHELAVVAEPTVDASEWKDGEPLKFTARVEVRPKIEKVVTAGIEVGTHSHPVTDQQIEDEINEIRTRQAEVRVPEPMRPAKANDLLTIAYTVTIDGAPREDMAATDRDVDLGSGSLIEAFEKGLLGTQPGDKKDVTVEFEPDHQAEELRGKKAVFAIEVKALKERLLPELDDEFAKDVGDYATLADLRAKIREGLEKMAAQHTESDLKEKLIGALLEKNPLELPPSLVAQEERRAAYEFASYMGMTGQMQRMTEELQSTIRASAERKVRAALILAALARQEKIEVGEADVEAKFAEISERTGKHVAKVKAEFSGERRGLIENQVLEAKLMGYLKSVAKLREVTPEEAHAHDHAPGHGHAHK